MQKLIPAVGVPIKFKDVFNSIWMSISQKRITLLIDFKKKISTKIGFKYVRTFQSGYLALYNLLINIKSSNQNSEVIIPVYTCPSVYFAVKNANLIPVFIDSDINTINNSFDQIKNKISENTLAIIVLHLFGCYSVDIKQLRELLIKLNRTDIAIIEDMCQALGNIKNLRNCDEQYGDYGILSFGRAKMISTVNGGAIVSNKKSIMEFGSNFNSNSFFENIYICIKSFFFSVIINPNFFKIGHLILRKRRLQDPYYLNEYKFIDHSRNGEITDFQLSLGLNMLNKLDNWHLLRITNANFYLKYFSDSSKFIIQPSTNNLYLRFSVLFKNNSDREYVKEFLYKNGIITSTVDYPILSTINNFQACISSSNYKNASFVASNILTFPTHPGVKMALYTDLFDKLSQILKDRNLSSSE